MPTLGLRPRATLRRVFTHDACPAAYLHLHIVSGQSGSAALQAFMHHSSDAAGEMALQLPLPADALSLIHI